MNFQEQFDRYQRVVLSNALTEMENVALCPRVSCQSPGAISVVYVLSLRCTLR